MKEPNPTRKEIKTKSSRSSQIKMVVGGIFANCITSKGEQIRILKYSHLELYFDSGPFWTFLILPYIETDRAIWLP